MSLSVFHVTSNETCATCCEEFSIGEKNILAHKVGQKLIHPMHRSCWENILTNWKSCCPLCFVNIDAKEEPIFNVARMIASIASSMIGSLLAAPFEALLGRVGKIGVPVGVGVATYHLINSKNDRLVAFTAGSIAAIGIHCLSFKDDVFPFGALGNSLGAAIYLKKDWKMVASALSGFAVTFFFVQ